MTHTLPDPNPPVTLLNRMRATIVAMHDHPETYDTRTLAAIRAASMELAKVTDGEMYRREHL